MIRLFVSPFLSTLALASASLDIKRAGSNSVHPLQHASLTQPRAHRRVSRVRLGVLLRPREVRAFRRRKRRERAIGVGSEEVGGGAVVDLGASRAEGARVRRAKAVAGGHGGGAAGLAGG